MQGRVDNIHCSGYIHGYITRKTYDSLKIFRESLKEVCKLEIQNCWNLIACSIQMAQKKLPDFFFSFFSSDMAARRAPDRLLWFYSAKLLLTKTFPSNFYSFFFDR